MKFRLDIVQKLNRIIINTKNEIEYTRHTSSIYNSSMNEEINVLNRILNTVVKAKKKVVNIINFENNS